MLFFFFYIYNLEPQNTGLVDVKGNYIKKDQREFLCTKIYNLSIVIKNVIWPEKNFDA